MLFKLKQARKQYQVYKYAKKTNRVPGKKVITGTCDADVTKAASAARGPLPKSDVPKLSNNSPWVLIQRPVRMAKNPRPLGGTSTSGVDRSSVPVNMKP